MRKKGCITIVFLSILLLWPGLSIAEKVKVRVILENANIRLKPDISSMIITGVSLGAILESDGQVEEWYKVNLPPDEKGFVVSGYIHSSEVEVLEEKAVEEKPVEVKTVSIQPSPQPVDQSSRGSGMSIGIKLSGGINHLFLGDINTYLEGYSDYLADNHTIDGEFKKIRYGFDFEGDVIIYLMPQFGIGIGSGYIYGKKGKNTNIISFPMDDATVVVADEMEVSAVPIRLGVYYFPPLSSKARFFLNAGAGYYFVSWSEAWQNDLNGHWHTMDRKARGQCLGFQGGIGVEFDFAQNIAFVIEGYGRIVKSNDLQGEHEEAANSALIGTIGQNPSPEGTLYYYEKNYPTLIIRDAEPYGSTLRNIRQAGINFSGFTARAGIKIRF